MATVVNYLFGLEALAIHGGASPAAMAGVADMRAHAQARAGLVPALKEARVRDFTEDGGYEKLMRTAVELRESRRTCRNGGPRLSGSAAKWPCCCCDKRSPAHRGHVGLEARRGTDPPGGRKLELAWVQGKTGREIDIGTVARDRRRPR